MKTKNKTTEYSEKAAEEFIQTVVCIDDQRFPLEPVGRRLAEGLAKSLENETTSQTNSRKKSGQPEDDQNERDYRDFNDLVFNFGKMGIICSLIQPNDIEGKLTENESIINLCNTADVLIVDWDIGGDRGDRIKELVIKLIEDSQEIDPKRLRLVIIYTNVEVDRVLYSLHNEAKSAIDGYNEELDPSDDSAFGVNGCRIVTVPKEWNLHTRSDKRVSLESLPGKVIHEFAKLSPGLLSAAVLTGLSKVRTNSQRILSKFPEEIDAAFLTHFLQSVPSGQAFDHIIPLIESEIGSILFDDLPNPAITKEILLDWIDNKWIPNSSVPEILGAESMKDAIKGLLSDRYENRDKGNISSEIEEKIEKIAEYPHLLLKNEDDDANHRFSHLMSSKSFYSSYPKSLMLGTIIKENFGNERYFLCIQPACDCVRLSSKTNFLFVRLQVTYACNGSFEKATHIVEASDGNRNYVGLYYTPKIRNVTFIEFKRQKGDHEIKTKDGSNVFKAVGKTDNEYKWIDQLKPDHAQRAVEKFASELSRVGLTESEWLRRLS